MREFLQNVQNVLREALKGPIIIPFTYRERLQEDRDFANKISNSRRTIREEEVAIAERKWRRPIPLEITTLGRLLDSGLAIRPFLESW